GFLRMWSIHPAQIEPILRAMQPEAAEIETAAAVLAAAQSAEWAPIRVGDALHDRASYRYCWSVLQQARAAGATLPAAPPAFFGTVRARSSSRRPRWSVGSRPPSTPGPIRIS